MRRGPARRVGLLLGLCLAGAAWAQDEEADTSQRHRVEGNRLIFDTVAKVDGEERGVRGSDVKALRNLLRQHKDITVLALESTGGSHYSSVEIGELVFDFGLDTHVPNICESACVTTFLGGTTRTLARGARLGFHQLYWTPEDVEEYYKDNREWHEWETPFDFASWMYRDTQSETFNRLT